MVATVSTFRSLKGCQVEEGILGTGVKSISRQFPLHIRMSFANHGCPAGSEVCTPKRLKTSWLAFSEWCQRGASCSLSEAPKGSTNQDLNRKSTAPIDGIRQGKIHGGLFAKAWARLREGNMGWCSVLGLVRGRTSRRETGERADIRTQGESGMQSFLQLPTPELWSPKVTCC